MIGYTFDENVVLSKDEEVIKKLQADLEILVQTDTYSDTSKFTLEEFNTLSCITEVCGDYEERDGIYFLRFESRCKGVYNTNIQRVLTELYPDTTYIVASSNPDTETYVNTDESKNYLPYKYRLKSDEERDFSDFQDLLDYLEYPMDAYQSFEQLKAEFANKNVYIYEYGNIIEIG